MIVDKSLSYATFAIFATFCSIFLLEQKNAKIAKKMNAWFGSRFGPSWLVSKRESYFSIDP